MAVDATLRSKQAAAARREVTAWSTIRPVLMPLASLKLTVALLAAGMFLVFAGTMALTRYDMWDVVRGFFRTPIVWIEFQNFLPPAFFPDKPQLPGGFPFPGGWVIGALMFVNLLAAHAVRFTVQTRGLRLLGGVAVIALGLVVTGLVISAFEDRDGAQTPGWISYAALWGAFKWGVVLVAAGVVAATVRLFLQGDPRFRLHRWVLLTVSAALASAASYLLLAGESARMNDPSMRILSQLLSATFAGSVLLAGCVLAFKKRAGIVVIHFGIGLLMFNELWVTTTHVESQVTLEEEQGGRANRVSANYAHDIRELELAIMDRGAGADGQDRTLAIPESRLLNQASQNGESESAPVSEESLPFDVQVLKFYRNSDAQFLPSDQRNDVVTAGHGRFVKLTKKPPVTGVDKGENQPAAYVRFMDKATGETLGTHLVSVDQTSLADWAATNLSGLEEVAVGGRKYEVYLRYKRINKPYTVTLKDVRRDNYLGTDTPRDYSSDVLIQGQNARGETVLTTAHIWMNNPLRLLGDTFYQSGHHKAGLFFGERSTLSVVTNGGWMIPYVCCMIVAVGLCFQFISTLMRFLTKLVAAPAVSAPGVPVTATLAEDAAPRESRDDAGRRGAGQRSAAPAARRDKRDKRASDRESKKENPQVDLSPQLSASPPRTWPNWVIPLVVLLVFVYGVGRGFRPPGVRADGLRLYEFGQVPVVYEGRPKPVDSLARNSLRILSGKEEYIDYRVTDDEVSWRGKLMRVLTGNPDSGKPKTLAMVWLLDVMSGSDDARQQKIIRVDNGEVLVHLGLKPRKGHLYSYDEINASRKQFEEAREQALAEQERNPKGLSIFQRKILKLAEQLSLFDKLLVAHVVPPKDEGLLPLVSFFAKVAEMQAGDPRRGDQLAMVPFLAPRNSEDKPWEPLAYAAARARVHQLAAQYKAKSLPELEESLLQNMTGEAITAQAEQFLMQQFAIGTIADVLSKEGGPPRSREELRKLAIERYNQLPESVLRPLEQRLREMLRDMPAEERQAQLDQAREVVMADRAGIAQRLRQVYQPRLGEILALIVWDEPLGRPEPVAVALMNLMHAARDNKDDNTKRDVSAFNTALDDCQVAMESAVARDYQPGKTRFEAYFNHAAPFSYASVTHLIAFILVALSWVLALFGWRKPFNNTATYLILLALVIHSLAILARLYISGRPPVTNLYSSAVFIGWGAVVAGLIIERLMNIGVGNALASAAGFSTLYIAHRLSGDGDTFTVLQAVLDTQFWLATHVVCITLGYAATFVAGLLGVFYVLAGILSPVLSRKMSELSTENSAFGTTVAASIALVALGPTAAIKTVAAAKALRAVGALAPNMTLSQLLGKVIYGVVCFGLIFSFVGTVLGGLWADDSWGRFWGWDPKENGALLIVIWNAIVLHARWGGMVKDRGLAVLAIGGNIVTAWSWFGVNELGIGLHSYGFTEGVMLALSIFWATQFVLIIVGALPKSWWWSFSLPDGGDGAEQGS